MTEVIRVLLVEDHTAFRQALELTFAREPDFRVVGQAGTLAEARGQLSGVDVAVLDLDLPDGNGGNLIKGLHALNPAAQALVLTASAGRADLARAVALGAAGALHKSVPVSDVIRAVRSLYADDPLLTPQELNEFLRLAHEERAEEQATRRSLGQLTPREREVLQALAEGLSDKEIAARLHVSKQTVHTHMVHLLAKLGVESRLQALIAAVKHGVVDLP